MMYFILKIRNLLIVSIFLFMFFYGGAIALSRSLSNANESIHNIKERLHKKKLELESFFKKNPDAKKIFKIRDSFYSQTTTTLFKKGNRKFHKYCADIKLSKNVKKLRALLYEINEYKYAINKKTKEYYVYCKNKSDKNFDKKATNNHLKILKNEFPQKKVELEKLKKKLPTNVYKNIQYVINILSPIVMINRYISINYSPKIAIIRTDIQILEYKLKKLGDVNNDEYIANKVDKIKKELVALEKIKNTLEGKLPNSDKFLSKRNIYGEFCDYFRKNEKYRKYVKSLPHKKEIKKLKHMIWKNNTIEIIKNPEIATTIELVKKKLKCKEDIKLLKQTGINVNKCLFFANYFSQHSNVNKVNNNTLMQQLAIPKYIADYWRTYFCFENLYRLYFMFSSVIDAPVKQKANIIRKLLGDLKQSILHIENPEEKKKINIFIKKSLYKIEGVPVQNNLKYYYRIKLFSTVMKDTKKVNVIKNILQESKLMRKAVVSIIIGFRSNRNVKRHIKKYNQKLDYNNFKKYWLVLQKMSQKLPREIFPDMNEQKIEKYPIAIRQAAELNAQYFLECFFTPYLVFDNQ